MAGFPSLISQLKEEEKLPCIVFCFNRAYCEQLTLLTCSKFSREVKKVKMSPAYIEKEAARLKETEKSRKMEKKLRDKNDKLVTQEAKMQNQQREQKPFRPTTATHTFNMGEEDLTALATLNSVFKEFPQFCLVSRCTLGQEDAQFICDRIQYESRLFQEAMKFGISWHHAGNNARMRNATEMLFREQFLNVVVATTTLAQVK